MLLFLSIKSALLMDNHITTNFMKRRFDFAFVTDTNRRLFTFQEIPAFNRKTAAVVFEGLTQTAAQRDTNISV